MYETLTRWEIFKSLFVKHPRLVYATIAKKTTDDIISIVRNKSKKEMDKILYANKELSTKLSVCDDKLSKLIIEKTNVDDELLDARNTIVSLTDKVQELERMLTVYKSDISAYISKNKELVNVIDQKSHDYESAQIMIKDLEERLTKCFNSKKALDKPSKKKKTLTKKDVLAIREAKSTELRKLASKYGLTIDKLKDIKDKKLYKKW